MSEEDLLFTVKHPDGSEDHYVPLAAFSTAIDEVYALRAGMAYEAASIRAHLAYKTFPKSRRRFAEQQIERCEAAARGDSEPHNLIDMTFRKRALREAGADDCLTNWQWWDGFVARRKARREAKEQS